MWKYRKNCTDRNRFSNITDDLDNCYLCKLNKATELHEVFNGAYRQKSKDYGCVVPLCRKCHEKIHCNQSEDVKLKREVQLQFIEAFSGDKYREVFKKSYEL